MRLSEIWQALPSELVERILAHHVDEFADDPAYTWAVLRHLSANQKHRIERHFESFWLPKLSITVYQGSRNQFEYEFDSGPQTADADHKAVLSRIEGTSTSATQEDVLAAWAQYNPASSRNVTVRLGEGYLSDGCKGGYIVNDTGLPGLDVLDGGESICFRWKEAMNELLREELYIRRVGERLVCTGPPFLTLTP